jgi:ribosomal protein S18 acetylase RimI-like enzyme
MIRRATPADVDGIAQVHVQAWRESYPGLMPQAAIEARSVETRMSQWRNTLAESDRLTFVYVAEEDRAICGFGSAGTIRWTGLSTGSEVSALYLLDAVKRRGIGRMLFVRLLGELAVRGFTSTGLWVLTRNTPARRFYEALGGRSGGTRVERRGEYVLDEIAYIWDDLAGFALL